MSDQSDAQPKNLSREGKKIFFPSPPTTRTGRMWKRLVRGCGRKNKKIQNPEWRTYALQRFPGLVGDCMLNIMDFIDRLISFFPIAILCKVRHSHEWQGVKTPHASHHNKN
jgi:hypothetical protein